MKKAILLTALALLAVCVFATVASAQATSCTSGNSHGNTFIDTAGNDCAKGHGGDDVAFFGRFGDDTDTFFGGKGNDKGNVADGDTLDTVSGQKGSKDVCVADAQSEIGVGCNRVVVDDVVTKG